MKLISFSEYNSLMESTLLTEMRGFEYNNSTYTVGVTGEGEHNYYKDGKKITEPEYQKALKAANAVNPQAEKTPPQKPAVTPPSQKSPEEKTKKLGKEISKTRAKANVQKSLEDKVFNNPDLDDDQKEEVVKELIKRTDMEYQEGEAGLEFYPVDKKTKRSVSVRLNRKEDGKLDFEHPEYREARKTEDGEYKQAQSERYALDDRINQVFLYGGEKEAQKLLDDLVNTKDYSKQESKAEVSYTSPFKRDSSAVKLSIPKSEKGGLIWKNAKFEVITDDE